MTDSSHPSPTTPNYVDETITLLGDRDPIASLAEMPEWLTTHLDDLPETALSVPEGPGKWSIVQVLAHLADAAEAFHAFSMQRRWNMHVWRSATPADMNRIGVHSERGEETFDRLLRMAAGHDLRHQRQIMRIIATLP
jgi:hypothetical protein